MKICCISDLHGNLNFSIPECELLLIAGDITPHSFYIDARYWLIDNFCNWLKQQPYKHCYWIAGNHDKILDHNSFLSIDEIYGWFDSINATYLDNCVATYKGLKILGCPWSVKFGNWSFMKEESDLYRMYSYFPNVIDILINHGPAYSLLDKVISGENAGSRALLEYIDRVKPKLVVCGHLHESYGEVKYGQSHIVNCSVLNESYELVNKPIIVDL